MSLGKIGFVVCLLSVLTGGVFAAEITQDFYVSSDTWLDQGTPTVNQNASSQVYVRGEGNQIHALLKWDLSSISTEATIKGVELFVYKTSASAMFYPTMYKATTAWDEATATWNECSSGQAWTTSGGDYDGSGVKLQWSQYSLNNYVKADQTVAGNQDVFVGLVQDWVSNPGNNHGAVIKRDAATNIGSFASITGGNPAYLKVTYEVPEPASMAVIGLGAFSLLFRRKKR